MKKFISIILFIILSSFVYSENKIRLALIQSPLSSISQEVLKVAYQKINYEVEFITLPPARALADSSVGLVDGEVHRIESVGKKYPSLKRISVPINHFSLYTYSKDHNFYVSSKKSLENYLIGIKLGVVIVESYTKGLNVVTAVSDITNFRKLNRGRIDLIISTDINARGIIESNGFNDIRELEPALITTKLYHYLHESKAYLIPKLTEVLKEMEKNGEIIEIRNNMIEMGFD